MTAAIYVLARLALPVTLTPAAPPPVERGAPDSASVLRAWAFRWLESRKPFVGDD